MARLSIDELNDLSGVSDKDLEELYKHFRSAHTKLFNDINRWISLCDKTLDYFGKLDSTYDNDTMIYKYAKEIYYRGSLILDDVDIFDYYTSEYQSILTKLHNKDELIKNIRTLWSILNNNKKGIVERLSNCYGMYSEAYSRLNEWEDTYEG